MPPGDLSEAELQALKVIRNHVAHEGGFPSVRHVQAELGYKSPRSAALLIMQLEKKKYIKRDSYGSLTLRPKAALENERSETVKVPLVGDVACGRPILAQENIQAYFAVSTDIAKKPSTYFFLRARGDSMDREGINEGDLLLVRSQNTANSGDTVVALLDDEATVKKLEIKPDYVVLNPRSTNPSHTPIILRQDFRVQGVVIMVVRIDNEK